MGIINKNKIHWTQNRNMKHTTHKMLKCRTESTLKLTALEFLCCRVTSARIHNFGTMFCKIVLTNTNSFVPTQHLCPCRWTLISLSFFSLLISKRVAQKNWYGVTLLWRIVRRKDWWRCWRQTSDCIQWQVPFPLLWPSRQFSQWRDVCCMGYFYGVPRNRNMVAWGQRAELRCFGEHVTLQIDSQAITAKDNYKTSTNTKLQHSHIKQGNTKQEGKQNHTVQYYSEWHKYRVIHTSLRDFRTRLRNNQDRHGRKAHINR